MVKALINAYTENTYIINEGHEAYIIDPGAHAKEIIDYVTANDLDVKGILLTHGHFDHMYSINEVQDAFDCPIYIHKDERDFLFDPNLNLSNTIRKAIAVKQKKAIVTIDETDTLTLGQETITILHVPGHTRGSVAYRYRRFLFSGDILFKGTIGRTDLPTSSPEAIETSLRRMVTELDDNTVVYPGHGHFTTILNEKYENPFLKHL